MIKLTLFMTKFKLGDIVLVIFRQPDGQRKQRLALVVLDIGDDDVVLAPITSKKRTSRGDYKIKNWKQAGLLLDSWVRLAKVTCLSKEDVGQKLGNLSSTDKKNIALNWNKLYRMK